MSNASSKIKYYEKKIGMKPCFYFWDNDMTSKRIKDTRQPEWAEQREELGFDERELWSLRTTLAAYIYPRLKAFEENGCSYPSNLTNKEWREIVHKMARAFELVILKEQGDVDLTDCYKEMQEGLQLFATHYMDLWD